MAGRYSKLHKFQKLLFSPPRQRHFSQMIRTLPIYLTVVRDADIHTANNRKGEIVGRLLLQAVWLPGNDPV